MKKEEEQPLEQTHIETAPEVVSEPLPSKYSKILGSTKGKSKLPVMYRDWFLDYASYVILERAVPHLDDGLKPVQRRILHALKRMDDGRFNKVANVIGFTMQFHPHGDASIGDALVGLGQKNLLIETQGNWGNLLTGDSAAAPRYIEARLSKFALDVVFNNKTTEWISSYDGRNQEPVTLPVKFPLLLSQGVEGIAVGLSTKILPHNFCELIEASVKYLRGEEFEIYPDFPTGGMADCQRYNDGLRGGAVKVRAKISKGDRRTLIISEIPYGETTSSVIESIIKANDKSKIRIKKVDDNTAANVEIVVHLANDVSADKTIDALYAFTKCEVSISPNACIIYDQKPLFIGVSEILRRSVDNTLALLKRELEIRLDELLLDWHMSSLEKIFIENRIYNLIEECRSKEEVYQTIDRALDPFKSLLRREVSHEDVVKLTEIKIMRISRYDAFRADEHIASIEEQMQQVEKNLGELVRYTIDYYREILRKYGKGRERQTQLTSFDSIEVANVAVANAKLYVNRSEGFFGIGTQMRKDELVCDCSDIDDIILFSKSGKYIIKKVADKDFYVKNIYHIRVFKRSDERTIYNVIYRDGKNGAIMMKRCAITSITRDREYDITKGTPDSEILYMSVNPNGEAETLKIYFKPRPRLKKVIEELDFSKLSIKGRSSQGNLLTRYALHKITLKQKGVSTLGGQDVWFDRDIRRLNAEGRGEFIGNFESNDKIVVFTASCSYYTNGYELSQHFPEDVTRVEKWDSQRIYTVVYVDSELSLHYIKRFQAKLADNKPQQYLEPSNPEVLVLTDDYPLLELIYGGRYSSRGAEQIDVSTFIGVKSHSAKGKRLSTLTLSQINPLEPLVKDKVAEPIAPSPEEQNEEEPQEEPQSEQLGLF
ncbi:MAG: DNA gyrase/topoisomerase IV subunit A [Rikenellaceae bacterium]